jgi:hypothetical protein
MEEIEKNKPIYIYIIYYYNNYLYIYIYIVVLYYIYTKMGKKKTTPLPAALSIQHLQAVQRHCASPRPSCTTKAWLQTPATWLGYSGRK